jgi:hypothetical protein
MNNDNFRNELQKWLPIFNKQGMVYFYNTDTNETSWSFPKYYDPGIKKYINIL